MSSGGGSSNALECWQVQVGVPPCLAFLHCAFSNVSSKSQFWRQTEQCFGMLASPSGSPTLFSFSPLCIFKCLLKIAVLEADRAMLWNAGKSHPVDREVGVPSPGKLAPLACAAIAAIAATNAAHCSCQCFLLFTYGQHSWTWAPSLPSPPSPLIKSV